jgi:hypothetical protein
MSATRKALNEVAERNAIIFCIARVGGVDISVGPFWRGRGVAIMKLIQVYLNGIGKSCGCS